MNARLQQWMLTFRVLACLAAALWAWRAGAYAAGGALVLLLGWGWAGALLPRFLLMKARSAQDRSRPASRWELARTWWREVLTSERVFGVLQPWLHARQPDHVPAHSLQRGVLLLHGFSCNRGLWLPWMQELQRNDVPHIALSLEPAYGSIDDYADAIEAAVQRLERCAGEGGPAPLIVGHSMGGLAARAWWRRYGREGRVHRFITLGSPHAGTRLARLSHTRNGRQMRRDSPWLAELRASETPALYARFDCLYSDCDQIVYPAETAVLPGSRALLLAGTAHLDLVFAAQSLDCVREHLGLPARSAPTEA